MGKADFQQIYEHVKSQAVNGNVSCKISTFSDRFNEANNYAGVIVYAINGKTAWVNNGGKCAGCNGRSFYIIIKNTAHFPNQRDVGGGRVHYYPIEEILGASLVKDKVLCGGFAYFQGSLKFSSIWLNQNEQIGFNGDYAPSDWSKFLSKKEQFLVEYCWNRYKESGPATVFTIPLDVENKILC